MGSRNQRMRANPITVESFDPMRPVKIEDGGVIVVFYRKPVSNQSYRYRGESSERELSMAIGRADREIRENLAPVFDSSENLIAAFERKGDMSKKHVNGKRLGIDVKTGLETRIPAPDKGKLAIVIDAKNTVYVLCPTTGDMTHNYMKRRAARRFGNDEYILMLGEIELAGIKNQKQRIVRIYKFDDDGIRGRGEVIPEKIIDGKMANRIMHVVSFATAGRLEIINNSCSERKNPVKVRRTKRISDRMRQVREGIQTNRA
ncbi:hypothetical protein C4577_05745 [Candidatus Parcubacteria bacterium]|nr:MAG: hypothetical protein C4577_05745 [Candidatus Parcubacteria bacterium]